MGRIKSRRDPCPKGGGWGGKQAETLIEVWFISKYIL